MIRRKRNRNRPYPFENLKQKIMRKIFTLLSILISFSAAAQNYNNEWINFNQTYYKFKIGQEGLYRIPKSVLDAVGIGNTQVQFFELWRNGKRVPFYPSVASGVLPANGYLEFYGKANDGKPDKDMYRDPNFQHTDKLSLISDTAMYFLSVNTNQSGFLVQDVVNNVAGNSLPVEPYYMQTSGYYFKERLNYGFAAVVNEYVYSSSYDKGEFWGTTDIYPGGPHVTQLSNMFIYSSGPASTIKFGAVGDALNPRSIKVQVNNTPILDTTMDYFNDIQGTVPVNTSLLNNSLTNVEFDNNSPVSTDRMCVSFFELTYPRLFNFSFQKNFGFTLPARAAGYFLNITNFNNNGIAPVLYDQSNGERYVGDITTSPGNIEFALPGSANERLLILVSEDPSNINSINSITPKTFTNFATAVNQGEYVIISNPLLYTSTSGKNPVDDYKNYRQSAEGGNHKVLIVDVNELQDQFGFGIKKHPLGVRNFIRYARASFSQGLNYIFLIGRGMAYDEYDFNASDPLADPLNLVPTFGTPASDNLLSAADLTMPVPTTPIGRLSVVRGDEIEDYLDKVKEYELAQKTAPNTLDGRQWMKNVVHVTGSSDPYLGTVLCNYMDTYKQIIQDTLYGGNVTTFCKTSTDPVEQLTSEALANLFAQGISILTYFGHSSSTTLEFNIDNPQNYNNQGKYPVFYVNGCNAGNFFTFYPQRFLVNETLSEKFVLAKERGSIAFIASTHFGIVNYLNLFLTGLYNVIGDVDYGKGLGVIQRDAMQAMINATGPFDYYSRMHAEEITLHGDPALVLNSEPKPDFVIEPQNININPAFISVAENSFQLKLKVVNIGKSESDSVWIDIKRQYPGTGGIATIYHQKIKALQYEDSLILNVPIVATRDKGQNKIIATINGDGSIDEVTMANNSASQDFFIFEDEARPIYPYNYSIVNTATQKLYASTADPFTSSKSYVMEMDTTQDFNSVSKISKTVTSPGGVLEFTPGISYKDSTVYYWRVALIPATGPYHWNGSSFIYLSNSSDGYNQSHYFQHTASDMQRIYIDSVTRKWKYGSRINNLFLRNGVFPTAANQAADFAATVNGNTVSSSVCGIGEVFFNVFDSVTFKPWFNAPFGSPGQYGSNVVCGVERVNQFEFSILDTASRRKIVNFLDAIPDNDYVVFRNVSFVDSTTNTYASTWAGDTSYLGSNNSMYHRMLFAGFNQIDSFTRPRAFIFVYQKNNHNFQPKWVFSQGVNDRITLASDCFTPDTLGYITSPAFGPAKAWQDVVWRGSSLENPSADNPTVDVIGVDTAGIETTLYTLDKNTQNFDVSSVPSTQFPYMKLRLRNIDSVNLTPYQLNYWRIHYSPVPEGAIASNLYFTSQDTLNFGEQLQFAVAFKNVSKTAFDSILSRITIIDKGNVQHPTLLAKQKPIISGDTIVARMQVDTKNYPGHNTLYLDVNTDNNQPEQAHFNNFLYRDFYVRTDNTNPILDVTFDGVHILNQDIVSAKPHIQIKLKDESKYLLLNDTSVSTVQIKYPDGTTRNYHFDNDTLRFTPATSGADNTATIDFTPAFTKQINPAGDNYELIVTGKDVSGNKAGPIQYRIGFTVITKPMISNLLNYPNPFSTSTAFVFTVTGSNIPSNIKIQILTVTGKIVREITKAELGPIHIGRNITEFKWDGTDQYGGKLGNGVYLYRVVTTLNGRSMDKYKAEGDNTDQYFTNGYGKMYLMR